MGRSSTAHERLLDAACQLMRRRGYASVGVAEICALADVRKGSFYHFFESKQALTLAVIDSHWAGQRMEWVATLSQPGSPLDRLEQLFRATRTTQEALRETAGAVSGCLLANLALELSGQEAAVQARLREVFEDEIGLILSVLEEAAAAGDIPAASAGRGTARAMVAQMEGMILFAKLNDDPALLDELWAQTARLLGARDAEALEGAAGRA
ncbi:TetR/AcrR family transcriptional regulator [Nonomuraea sp. NPDC050328]|uniref:TetR/AcrR family transcriptional regulator n=1 Tax=Nonomuraea sp. NPDC050328 TaxID=3364361 RepID=UPI0037954754